MTDKNIDPGAYIGHEPERQAESIPGGVGPADERISAYASRPGVEGEPDDHDNDEATARDDRQPPGEPEADSPGQRRR